MAAIQLPITNESGYYEIRLESIGGLGANLCAKMLGQLGMNDLGLNSACFSSYGSEKTGTPVKGYIRFCRMEQEIRVHSPVVHPHLLVVFHEALLENPQTLAGVEEQSQILVNTDCSPGLVAEKYKLSPHQLYCIPAQMIAMKSASRINVVMLGAIGRVMDFVEEEQLLQICKDTLGKKYPDALSGNLKGIQEGFRQVIQAQIASGAASRSVSSKTGWGYQTAPQGGINPCFGNIVTNDLSPSRQGYFPLFIKERCINCAKCDASCPDMVFQFQKGEYQGREMMVNMGLDYYHCKGCMRCVSVCPTNALVAAKEAEYPNKPYFMTNQELIRKPEYYEETGADGYITSESFLTEKRLDGGEV